MLYEIAHIIKNKCSFLWDVMEWGNSTVFALLYHNRLKMAEDVVDQGVPDPYVMRRVTKYDINTLYEFFSHQPDEAFKFFTPHGFDVRSLRKIVRNKSFLAFILIENNAGQERIVGYSFMRSFINGTSYRGYIVDYWYRGKGLAKIMGHGLNRVGDTLNLKMFKSISPDNPASMRVTQDVCDVEKIKQLNNGDYLMKCTSKELGGGRKKLAFRIFQEPHLTSVSQILCDYATC